MAEHIPEELQVFAVADASGELCELVVGHVKGHKTGEGGEEIVWQLVQVLLHYLQATVHCERTF